VVLGPLGGDDFAMLGFGFVTLAMSAKGLGTILVRAAVGTETRQ
jgi:hypothetical protein